MSSRPLTDRSGIQVWMKSDDGKDKLVGHWIGHGDLSGTNFTIVLANVVLEPYGPIAETPVSSATCEYLTLTVEKRSIKVDRYQLMLAKDPEEVLKHLIAKNKIPFSADKVHSVMEDCYFYTWKVLSGYFENIETLFDLPDFIPFDDGSRDMDTIRGERERGYPGLEYGA